MEKVPPYLINGVDLLLTLIEICDSINCISWATRFKKLKDTVAPIAPSIEQYAMDLSLTTLELKKEYIKLIIKLNLNNWASTIYQENDIHLTSLSFN